MKLENRLEILDSLGKELKELCNNDEHFGFPGFETIYNSNPWFTEDFVKHSLNEWSNLLGIENLKIWISKYDISNKLSDKTLGIIMAGNIPLVGMHDFICAFVSGVKLKIKLSSKDNVLMKWVIERVSEKSAFNNDRISLCEDQIKDFDAIIATGSNNSNRYFDFYFSRVPNILRKSRNSVAVLSGDETTEELERLADDIFMYFGLGCRSISKLYVPQNYSFEKMVKATHKYEYLKNCFKYANNLDYQYALLSMNRILLINAGHLYLLENNDLHAPVAILNYEFYNNKSEVFEELTKKSESLQCIVTKFNNIANTISFGDSQKPKLDEYADNIDTMSFLTSL